MSSALKAKEPEPRDSLKPSQNTPQRKRNCSLHLRFTTAEFAKFERRAAESGLDKNAFALQAVLKSKIIADTGRHDAIMALCQEAKDMRAELDRQGRMLKVILKPSKGQRELQPEEWDALIRSYSDIEKTMKLVNKIIKKSNGYFET